MLLNILLVTFCIQLQYSSGIMRFDSNDGFPSIMRFSQFGGVYFSPNEIYRRVPEIRGRKMKMALMEVSPNYGQSCFDPADLVKRTSRALFAKGQEPYRMGNLKFSVPLRSAVRSRQTNIYVERLSLFGLSDFSFIEDAKSDEQGGCPVMFFKWGRLRAICTIIAELEGLKNTGECELRTEEPLYMRVRLAKSEPVDPQIEMSQVNDMTVDVQGLEITSEESMAEIRRELETTLKEAINSEVRDILTDFVQNSLLKQTTSKLTYKLEDI
ncbi:uncharacterized protein [Parasteatoda tepidariorum]|uniref:uncharacterized protein n=1 Tax=Parasteatoda tepidariorum TaxID=114398 RepID=UPI00077FC76F|nr:uncharacterized protein LOC107440595 [Parasteatoda tepidariorum]